jgi:hypothetical protein
MTNTTTTESLLADALPPLPKVDGYDKRVDGHYSAETLRKYALAALAQHDPRAKAEAGLRERVAEIIVRMDAATGKCKDVNYLTVDYWQDELKAALSGETK